MICETPELFVTPAPLIVRTAPFGAVPITYALAPDWKIISATSMSIANEMILLLETPKVAVSLGPFGNVVGVQLLGLIQSSSTGLRFQVALPAWVSWLEKKQRKATATKLNLVLLFI
jgi:hypothetical protein